MDVTGGLSLDASVLINLLATEQPWEILGALGCKCFAAEDVVREVKRDPISGRPYDPTHHPLRRSPSVQVVDLSEAELELFLALVGAEAPDGLGDGEAAAIAVACVRRCAVALDDRKARRIVRQRHPSVPMVMTVDILCAEEVSRRLGRTATEAAFQKAKQFGRMHVPRAT